MNQHYTIPVSDCNTQKCILVASWALANDIRVSIRNEYLYTTVTPETLENLQTKFEWLGVPEISEPEPWENVVFTVDVVPMLSK